MSDTEGMSLADFAAQEAPEPEAPEPDEPMEMEPESEPSDNIETVAGDEIGSTEAEPEAPSEPEQPAEDEPGAAPDTDPDMVVEYSKKGYPKPTFDPDGLDGVAKEVQDHWRRVRSVDRREEVEFRKRYEGIDPDAARRDIAAQDELWRSEDFEPARRIIQAKLGNAQDPGDRLALAFLDKSHPEHLRVRQLIQHALAGTVPQQAQKLAPPGQLPPGIYDADMGTLDQQKLAEWQAQRERQIVEQVREQFERSQQQAQPEPTSPPNGQDNLRRVFQDFCEYEGIDPETAAPRIYRAFNLLKADGIDVPNGLKGFRMLWDRAKEDRKQQLAETQAAEVARTKRASTPRPRSATPDSGPALTAGMTLADFERMESGEIS